MSVLCAACHIRLTPVSAGLLNLAPVLRSPVIWPHPSGLILQDPHDSQIYEVILTIVYAKQIISRDEWLTLVMKLHQP